MSKKNSGKKLGASLLFTLALICSTYLLLPNGDSVGAAPQMPQGISSKALTASAKADQKQMRKALGQLPLSFEMNRGQFDPEVQFASRGAGYKAFFTQTEAVFVLRKPGVAPAKVSAPLQGTIPQRSTQAMQERAQQSAERAASKAVLRMSLTGANPAPGITGVDELPGKINYFRGNLEQKWVTNIPTFRRVSYSAVYPGIDLVYYGKGNQLEYDLVIAPGADPNRIAFAFDGAERVEIDAASGALVITAAGGAQLRQEKPLIYQEVGGMRRAVSGGYTVNGNGAGFRVGEYDRSQPLVIDPAIINYSTYLAGEDDDRVNGIAADADGNAYAVGFTESEIFPVKNAYQPGQNNDAPQAFITKFNADGSQLTWSTYLGGSGIEGEGGPSGEGAYGVAVDGDRNVYVTGFTFSFDFPVRNAMQPYQSDGGCCFNSDSFITKLNAAGDQLVFSTYFGGADGSDSGRGIALDKNNNIYVVGYTNSFAFPTTNPIQREIDGRTDHFHNNEENWDGYLAKIDASGQFRVYSTYIGGPSEDIATAVAVDQNGAAYVTGWTNSTQPEPTPDLSATPTPPPDPSATPTPTPNPTPATHFPITDNAFQKNPGGGGFTRDAFVTKVDPAGSQYIYSTYLGGNEGDVAWGIALGPDRSAYVTGYSNSGLRSSAPRIVVSPGETEFPTTANAYQPHNAGGFDAFLSRLNPDGSDLIYSTYIGGSLDEGDDASNVCLDCSDRIDGGAVAVDVLGNAYITGWTESTFVATPTPSATATATATSTIGDRPSAPNGAPSPTPVNFPTKDAFQPEPGSNPGTSGTDARDAFVCMFDTSKDGDNSLVYSSFLGGSHRDEGQAITVDPGGNPFVAGWTESSCSCDASTGILQASPVNDFPTTPGAFQEEPGSFDDGFVVALVGGSSTVIGQGQGFTISGQVTLKDDGSPVEGVTITLHKPDNTTVTTTTDAQGLYSFQNLPAIPEAPYTVTPSGLGYEYMPASQEVILTNKNERADFTASFPEPTPTPSASPTATATATATGTPNSQPVNLSTRLHVLTGDQVGIGGFIITGSAPKHVIVRAIGPDLRRFGIPNPLEDPVLELHGPGSFATITNNNWRDTQETQIKNTGLAPTNDLESAIDVTLAPGTYTGIIRGNNEGTGIGLIEVYDLDTAAASKLSNISTRGFVGGTPGDSVIAGFVLGNGNASDRVVIRGLGPSLSAQGVPNTLQNPTLELHNGNGTLLFTNNDWQDNPTQAAEIAAAGFAPSDSREAAIAVTLPPGLYTAILAGLGNTTGNALVEIYDRGP
jgi:carboxypeptidase family protein/beta-propeller repeat-containing protein